ncbi:hypothetical protein BGZ96_002114 [Linnemannia gamsii]|uniref:Peptidase M48 domain-containing protein n=1 Tax=Linnemannia gamsii TaxID=64522 RepID=A0ABQ7K8Z6_9FUNG|nr:hypothetical protein BGZ96_002114 [Linnemannia gamsii]
MLSAAFRNKVARSPLAHPQPTKAAAASCLFGHSKGSAQLTPSGSARVIIGQQRQLTTYTRRTLNRYLVPTKSAGTTATTGNTFLTPSSIPKPSASGVTTHPSGFSIGTAARPRGGRFFALLGRQQLPHLQQHVSPFHTSRPNQLPLPILPAAIFTLKTPVTALVLRMISRVSLTLLPLSAKQSPKVILTLVLIPPVCFGLVIFAGLEAAPNTGRWRFLFTNEEEELEMLQDEIPQFLSSIATIQDEQDPRVQLVKHILQNLLSSSVEQDGSTLRTGIVERLEKRHAEAQERLKTLQQQQQEQQGVLSGDSQDSITTPQVAKSIVSTQSPFIPTTGTVLPPTPPILQSEEEDPELKEMTFDERPFQVFVAEDDAINAFSLGPPRLIFINSGLMDWLENDEDLIAAVVAHELAHVIQRHTMETHGRETVMLFLADLLRSALWTVSIPLGPWFNSWVDETTNNLLHFTASGPLHQTIEVEADTVSLTLMALAGYDPMHAVRLWEQWADKDQREMDEEDSVEVHKWTDWMYDHPPSAERARYLKEAVMPAREMWEKVLKRKKAPMKRFVSLDNRLKSHVDEDGDLTESTVQDVMETMDELLKKQEEEEEEERRRKGFKGTIRRWASWRPWAHSEAEVNVGSNEPAKAA